MSNTITGKTVIVTGSTRGIGKVIARYLAAEGANIVVSGRSDGAGTDGLPGTIQETVELIRGIGGQAIGVKCDLDLEEDLENLVAETVKHFGRVDVLVNNAAMFGKRQPFLESDASWLDTSYRVNARAPYLLMQKAGREMSKAGGGAIINITTGSVGAPPAPKGPVSAEEMDAIDPAYPISKAVVDRMTTSLASELWAHNIGVVALMPGFVVTERIRLNPLRPGRDMSAGQPAEIAAAACSFLIKNPLKYTGRKLVARELLQEEDLLDGVLAQLTVRS
jgi:NAD(P)-dependent dehydrogenase (short-subunit alcohol dehydrogenase family)